MGQQLEEEDLPLVEPELAGEEYAPPDPLPAVVPQAPEGSSPTSVPAAGEQDILHRYFLDQKLHREQLNNAEAAATKNRAYARFGGAAATLGNALAGGKQDNAPFEQMAKDAETPVAQVERQQKLEQGGDKLLLNYFMNKTRAEGLAGYRAKNLGIRQQHADIAGDRAETYAGAVGEKVTHNRKMEGIAEKNLGIRGAGLSLREGAQAAQAADKVGKDKVVVQSNTQLAQLEKGTHRLEEILSGKKPFTSTIKAELEKDAANILSGGNASSLGQLQRIEGHFWSEGLQKKIDAIRGFQGDIRAPKYAQQLYDLFTSMRGDIQKIRGGAAKRVKGTYGTAYSKNKLATQALEDSAKSLEAPPDEPENTEAPPAGPAKPYADPEKEKRYQEFKRSQGAQ